MLASVSAGIDSAQPCAARRSDAIRLMRIDSRIRSSAPQPNPLIPQYGLSRFQAGGADALGQPHPTPTRSGHNFSQTTTWVAIRACQTCSSLSKAADDVYGRRPAGLVCWFTLHAALSASRRDISKFDRRGTSVSYGPQHAIDALDRAFDLLQAYQADPLAAVDRLIADHPVFAMAHAFRAGALATATDKALGAELIKSVEPAETLAAKGNDRERTHIAAARAWRATVMASHRSPRRRGADAVRAAHRG